MKHPAHALAGVALIFAFAACSDGPTTLAPLFKKGGPGSGNGGITITPLEARFSAVLPITHDGDELYVDGVDKVLANINDPGHFIFDAADLSNSGKRRGQPDLPVRFLYLPTLLDASGATVWSGGLADAKLTTKDLSMFTGVTEDMRDLAPGESLDFLSAINWADEAAYYRLRFGRDCNGDLFDGGSRTVRVVRTDDGTGPRTWTIDTPAGVAHFCVHDGSEWTEASSTVAVSYVVDLVEIP